MTEKTKKEKKVIVIPAREDRDSENGQEKKKRRVAAYARVSTNKESQQTSYEAQVQYYTDYIKKQTGWSGHIYTETDGISEDDRGCRCRQY